LSERRQSFARNRIENDPRANAARDLLKDVNLAYQVLWAGRKALIETCVAPKNRIPIRSAALVTSHTYEAQIAHLRFTE